MNEKMRHIIGYTVGAAVFFVLIPFGFYELSKLDYLDGYRILINSTILKVLISFLTFFTGAYFVIWSNIFLFKIGKGGPADGFGISVSPKTKKLVTNGPYRYSRNPMVFGALSIYFSMVIYMNSFIGLLALLGMIILIVNYLKNSEEKRLLRDFGDEFVAYRKRVSMIIPLKQFKQ